MLVCRGDSLGLVLSGSSLIALQSVLSWDGEVSLTSLGGGGGTNFGGPPDALLGMGNGGLSPSVCGGGADCVIGAVVIEVLVSDSVGDNLSGSVGESAWRMRVATTNEGSFLRLPLGALIWIGLGFTGGGSFHDFGLVSFSELPDT